MRSLGRLAPRRPSTVWPKTSLGSTFQTCKSQKGPGGGGGGFPGPLASSFCSLLGRRSFTASQRPLNSTTSKATGSCNQGSRLRPKPKDTPFRARHPPEVPNPSQRRAALQVEEEVALETSHAFAALAALGAVEIEDSWAVEELSDSKCPHPAAEVSQNHQLPTPIPSNPILAPAPSCLLVVVG